MNKVLKAILLVTGLAAGSAFLGYTYVNNLNSQVLINHDKFTVNQGETYQSVTTRLANGTGFKGSPDLRIRLFTNLHPEFATIKAGVYDLSDVNTVGQALQKISNGQVINSQVLLIPGQTWRQWNASFEANKDNYDNDIKELVWSELAKKLNIVPIEGDIQFKNPEGYFLPETYHINYNGQVSQALQISALSLRNELDQAWAGRDKTIPLKSPYELLIVASLIEKEKGNNEEAATIASVFYNRMAKNMLLQTDPSVIYGLGDKYQGNLTKKDLQTPSDYNTYLNKGLPPTPIAMISKASLQAAAHPANTKYLYFMAVFGDSRHEFSETYEQHQKRVREYVSQYQKFYKK